MTNATQNIAQNIINQLPRGWAAMTGARDLIDLGDGLRFKIGRNAKRVTHVQIVLDPSDTYTVTFYRITKHGLDVQTVAELADVYADMLRDVIESRTGLYLSM